MSKDKLQHVALGAIAAVAFLFLLFVANAISIPLAVVFAGVLVGVGYEINQKIRGEGVVDWLDAVATIAGAFVVALITVWM